MKRLVLLLLIASAALAQPRIGIIEIYGNRRVPSGKILNALGVRPGEPLPKSKGEAEERIEKLDGVLRARLEAYCCDQGQVILYTGIEERGALSFQVRPAPGDETLALPEEVKAAYADFSSALARASAAADLKEDLSAGHSLMENLSCRIAQQRFLGLSEIHLDAILNILRNAANPEERSVAAYLAGYAPDKSAVAAPLLAALRDPDPSVRLNAARSLRAIAFLAFSRPQLKLRVQPTWFVEMLNSIELADRLEALRTLQLYVDFKDPAATAQLRERALPPLFEMARWHHLPHALPPYLLLGALAGIPEEQLQQAWSAGEREKMLASIARRLTARPR